MKKILSYISVMTAAAMLAAPVAAYAEEEEKPDVVMNKTVSGPDANGIYNIQLETYVTGKMIHTEENVRIPGDFILLLDTSSSMSGSYPFNTWREETRSFSYDRCCGSGRTYYYKWTDGNTYQIKGIANRSSVFSSSRTWLYFEVGTTRYYLKGDKVIQAKDRTNPTYDGNNSGTYPYDTSGNRIDCTVGRDETVWTGTLSQSVQYEDRMDALQIASSNFIDVVYADAVANNVEHRICIIQFSDADYPTRTDSDYTNPKNSNFLYESGDHGYTSIVKHFMAVNSETNVTTLKNAINKLSTYGDTASDYGLNLSNLELDYKSFNDNALRSRAVVMFTDGVPNHGGDPLKPEVANAAIQYSKTLKAKDVKVYSVGIMKNPDSDMINYMNGVSSNYPAAESISNLGKGGDQGFYIDASKQALEDVFETIAREVTEGGASVEVTSESLLLDVVTSDFTIPAGFDVSNLSVKVAGYDPETDTFSSELKNPSETISIGRKANTDGTTSISITGYPFSDHWCGEGCGTTGQKLVVVIPIVPKDDCIGGLDIPTNGPGSGLYLNDTDEDPISQFPIPTVNLPISIIVVKEGLANGESSIFEIFSSKDGYTSAIATLMLTGGLQETAKLVDLDPHYIYKVQESDWSWTYDVVTPGTGVLTTEGVKQNPFTFKNKKVDTDVKNAEATVINKFEKISK